MQSTSEAEYVALSLCAQEAIYLKNLILSLKIDDFGPVLIYEDNNGTISLAKNKVTNSRSKHIDIKYHFIREHVANEDVNLEYINTENQLADIFTKPLREDKFCSLRRELGIFDIES